MSAPPAHERRIDGSILLPFAIYTLVWGSTWLVIRDQLGTVSAHWSVAYRFLIAAAAMMLVARWQGHSIRPTRALLIAALPLALLQFCFNFNSVYLAEHHITSGLVATVFALLLIPNSLLAWAFLGQRPDRRFLAAAAVAVAGMALLFVQEYRAAPAARASIAIGIGWTLAGLLSAAGANIYQARERVMRFPLPALLAWAMALGAVADVAVALVLAGPPQVDPRPAYWLGLLYLALAASVLCFSLYFPVVRKIGPGRAAYSSVLVPVIAMALSTAFEGYRWTPLAAAGAALALAGMLLALAPRRKTAMLVEPPGAA